MPSPQVAVTRQRLTIGKYAVTGRIGKGGMGMVYRGWDEVLEREVAVKTLTVEGTLDQESRQRFEIEAKAAARLQHPNIVTVFELGADRGVPYIAMELLGGSDLESLLRSGDPMLLEEKLDVVVQVCRGLAFAHEKGLVHRDVKPSNIRVLDDGTAKIMDFGIAKLGGTGVTKTGMMVGTVHYMSPEQIRGKPLDGRSDVFSVGVMLHEMLSGRRPFAAAQATDVLMKIVREPAPPLPAVVLQDAPGLSEVLERALSKDPAGRQPTATRLAEDLGQVLAELQRSREAPPAHGPEALAAARRLLREGRAEDAVRQLAGLVSEAPDYVEARRALRQARRELLRSRRPPATQEDEYPELESTFQSAPSSRGPETRMQPTVVKAGQAATLSAEQPGTLTQNPFPTVSQAARTRLGPAEGTVTRVAQRRSLLLAGSLAGGLALLLAGGLAVRGLLQLGSTVVVRIPVRSQPSGAAVLVDGRLSGVVTDGELVLEGASGPHAQLTFRKPGYREETRMVPLPFDGQPVTVTLNPEGPVPVAVPAGGKLSLASEPPGATVTVDGRKQAGVTPLQVELDGTAHVLVFSSVGFRPAEVKLPAGARPPEVKVVLEADGPLGAVAVNAGYPVDVIWRGKQLARGQTSARLSLPAGRQTLTLVSATYFLKQTLNVDVPPGGAAALEPPGLGKLNVRAQPDNCEVAVDGTFVDYPPILDRPIAAGSHVVAFKWPDGSRREESIEVAPGKPAYVTGHKE
jgi:serine/threonine protein kinase